MSKIPFIILGFCLACLFGLAIYFFYSTQKADPNLQKNLIKKEIGSKVSPEDAIKLPNIPQITIDPKHLPQKPATNQQQYQLSTEDLNNSHYHFINDLYQALLNRIPSEDEHAKWLNTLSQGASREGVYHALVLGNEYYDLEQQAPRSNEKMANFAHYFLKKYTRINLPVDKLQEANELELKKYCTQKALEIFDVFASDQKQEESLRNWYAVLSSDLAHNFKIFNIKLRANPSKKIHKDWAKKMPLDILKSEIIIKLHRAFNSLM